MAKSGGAPRDAAARVKVVTSNMRHAVASNYCFLLLAIQIYLTLMSA